MDKLLTSDSPLAGVALGLAAAALFAVAPSGAPLLVALILLGLAMGRPTAATAQGVGVGALVGLAAAKGLMETAGLAPRAGFTGTPWLIAVALGAVPLLLALASRPRPIVARISR